MFEIMVDCQYAMHVLRKRLSMWFYRMSYAPCRCASTNNRALYVGLLQSEIFFWQISFGSSDIQFGV